MKKIDLSGLWDYYIPQQKKIINQGFQKIEDYQESVVPKVSFIKNGFCLPGSTCENQIGEKQEYFETFCKEAIRAPREKYEFIGKIWLQREIDIPREWESKDICLYMERVNVASSLWIDDVKIGRTIVELSTPHCYQLPPELKAGKHILTVCIDNRNLVNLDYMASGYSIDTQGYWNGIIGRIELQCEEICHIQDAQIYPNERGIEIKLVETSNMHTPCITTSAKTWLTVITPDGKRLETKCLEQRMYQSTQVSFFQYDMENYQEWDEFTPALYSLEIIYECGEDHDEKIFCFGMRVIERADKQLFLNHRPLALRGTIDCAIFPKTGYPAMDKKTWMQRFLALKEFGLNHIRCHAWCPPEAAFAAADETGMYLSVEMPFWLNHDCCALEVGEDQIQRQYFMQEAMNISKTYGNHPSFLMFSNGNELMGDFDLLNDLTTMIKGYDPRRFYTLTSNFDHPVLPCEDYLAAFEAGGNKIRIQDIHDKIAEDTCYNYDKAVADVSVPIISFETGQYCVYPDVDGIEKYDGNMLPVNLDVVRKSMKEHHVYHRLKDYVKASGDLAVKLYKEDMEAVYRTEKMGGYQLLSFTDYTGQSTATVGVFDAFHDSKQIVEPEKFREFCGPVVPLFMAKRIFSNQEVLEADFALYDHGKEKIVQPCYDFSLWDKEVCIYHTKQEKTHLSYSLEGIKKATILTVRLKVNDYQNSWRIFVFPEEDERNSSDYPVQITYFDESFEGTSKGSFIPVFWSPVHFPSAKPCGAIINQNHLVLADFPTDQYPDYQWKSLLENSVNMDVSKIDGEIELIIEVVPNYCDNTIRSPLFLATKDGKETLYCGFSLEEDTLECRQLKRSIMKYICLNK